MKIKTLSCSSPLIYCLPGTLTGKKYLYIRFTVSASFIYSQKNVTGQFNLVEQAVDIYPKVLKILK